MKSHRSFLLLTLLQALILGACSVAEQPVSNDLAVADVYTAAALTVAAQSLSAVPTGTPQPTVSPTPWPSPTLFLVNTPTSQSVSYTYSTANGCNDAVYVSDVTISDGSELAPGETFVKTWKLSNTGSCAWSEDYWIVFVSGEDMDSEETEIDQTVFVGETAEISVSLTAPDAEGTYTGYWRMADEDGSLFGGNVYVMIVVTEDAATSTPTPTEETETETPTPTSQATDTSTSVPATSTPEPGATLEPTSTTESGESGS